MYPYVFVSGPGSYEMGRPKQCIIINESLYSVSTVTRARAVPSRRKRPSCSHRQTNNVQDVGTPPVPSQTNNVKDVGTPPVPSQTNNVQDVGTPPVPSQTNNVKDVGTPPVPSNLCTSLTAVSTAVRRKVTKTVPEKATVEQLKPRLCGFV